LAHRVIRRQSGLEVLRTQTGDGPRRASRTPRRRLFQLASSLDAERNLHLELAMTAGFIAGNNDHFAAFFEANHFPRGRSNADHAALQTSREVFVSDKILET